MTSTARQLRQLLTIKAVNRGQYFANIVALKGRYKSYIKL
jgi:hypothetical protein